MSPAEKEKVITRFAPSPTGFLHIGSLRTALYAYLFARHNQGKFYLRIEDTDQKRKVEGAVEGLIEILKFFNLNWDNEKIMIQSERLPIYKKFAEQLVEEGKAYYCFCTEQRLEDLKKNQAQQKLPPMYDGKCRDLDLAEAKKQVAAGLGYVIRFKMPKTRQTEFNDVIRGKVTFDNKILDDQIILKSDGFPTYHLAAVVDDHEMEITHVIRGEDWLPSTPKHILMFKAFGWTVPVFAHLPLNLNPDKSKLSKRQGDVAVEDFLKKGYLKEALLNFVLLLGWNPGTEQEIFNFDEMIKTFSLEKVSKSGSVFDVKKLDWLNGEYIRMKSAEEFAELCLPYLSAAGIKADPELVKKAVITEQKRIKILGEIVEATRFFFEDLDFDPEFLIWKKQNHRETAQNLKMLADRLDQIPEDSWQEKSLEEEIKSFITTNNTGVGDILWPMRVALSGRKASPGPFEIATVLGKKETLRRIKKAIDLL
ncbi:MAG: glutamate--tRNA ligase [Candidatus Buchananbacteria bacterium]